MRQGRIRFMRRLQEPDIADRVRILYPEVTSGMRSAATMIHSKVMVVDDRFLRIGSANLNNRSMGTDTECDLAIEAGTDDERRAIARVRDNLLGEHCGTAGEEVAAELARRGSIIQVVDTLSHNGHRLRPIDDGEPEHSELAVYIESVADPERPIGADAFVSRILGGIFLRRQVSTVMKVCLVAMLLLIFAAAWKWSPLARFTEPDQIRSALAGFSEHRWGAFAVFAVFIAGGLVVFPVTILIAATAAAYGPWLGFVYATCGSLASAVVTYKIGRGLGKETLRDFLGPRLGRIRERIAAEGIIAVAMIRLVPVAPFTLVNLVAGASEIRFVDYVLGTLLGMVPGLIVMSALGHQLARILVDPTPLEFVWLIGAVLAWIAMAVGVQIAVSKYWSRTS
jgi:uncharacterized membrane protein YdjX (TVP38/TMEM64 family)